MEIKSIITQLFFVGIVVVFCSDFLWLVYVRVCSCFLLGFFSILFKPPRFFVVVFFFFKVLLQFFLLVYLFVFVVSFKLL